jgi:hypothetical protein
MAEIKLKHKSLNVVVLRLLHTHLKGSEYVINSIYINYLRDLLYVGYG